MTRISLLLPSELMCYGLYCIFKVWSKYIFLSVVNLFTPEKYSRGQFLEELHKIQNRSVLPSCSGQSHNWTILNFVDMSSGNWALAQNQVNWCTLCYFNTGPGIKLHRQLSSGLSGVSTDVRILLVWLESYEDFQNFPFEEIFAGISSDPTSSHHCIYL